MSDFTALKTVKAAKKHACDHCRGVIGRHTFYIQTSGAYEGGLFKVRAHPYCEQVRNELIDLCKIEPGDEMQDLPDELLESMHVTGVMDLITRYNLHANVVGGCVVSILMRDLIAAPNDKDHRGPVKQYNSNRNKYVTDSGASPCWVKSRFIEDIYISMIFLYKK